MGSAAPTVWNLHLSVANQLTRKEGLCVSVLNERVLHHLHHAKSRLERWEGNQNILEHKNSIFKENLALRKKTTLCTIKLWCLAPWICNLPFCYAHFPLTWLLFQLVIFLCTFPRIASGIPQQAALSCGFYVRELSCLDIGAVPPSLNDFATNKLHFLNRVCSGFLEPCCRGQHTIHNRSKQ